METDPLRSVLRISAENDIGVWQALSVTVIETLGRAELHPEFHPAYDAARDVLLGGLPEGRDAFPAFLEEIWRYLDASGGTYKVTASNAPIRLLACALRPTTGDYEEFLMTLSFVQEWNLLRASTLNLQDPEVENTAQRAAQNQLADKPTAQL